MKSSRRAFDIRNVKLKETLVELNCRQKWLAKESKVQLWKINQHINYGYPLKREERSAIAKALNRVSPPWAPVDVKGVTWIP